MQSIPRRENQIHLQKQQSIPVWAMASGIKLISNPMYSIGYCDTEKDRHPPAAMITTEAVTMTMMATTGMMMEIMRKKTKMKAKMTEKMAKKTTREKTTVRIKAPL